MVAAKGFFEVTSCFARCHFGKWHFSVGGPVRHGFDQHDGDTANHGPGAYEDPNPKDIFGITRRGVAFMEEQVAAGRPFYLQLSHYAVHTPILAGIDAQLPLPNPDYAAAADRQETGPRGRRVPARPRAGPPRRR